MTTLIVLAVLSWVSRAYATCLYSSFFQSIDAGAVGAPISCSPPDAYPATQIVSVLGQDSGGGFPYYDVYLTSGASCALSPSDSSFLYEYMASVYDDQGPVRFSLPETSCGPNPPCCAVFACRNSVFFGYKCQLRVSYQVPPLPPTPTSTPTSSITLSSSRTQTPTPSAGAPPSMTSTPGLKPTPSPTASPSPRPSATPRFSRSTCAFSDNFSLPATSQRDNYMFLTCAGTDASAVLPYYASVQMRNPNQCNVSLVGSTSCAINPVSTSPSRVVGLYYTTAPALYFSELDCGTRSRSCCVMLWTEDGICEGLGLAWSVEQRASTVLPPAAAAAGGRANATLVPGLSDALFWGLIGGGLFIISSCCAFVFCARCRKKTPETVSWETVGTAGSGPQANSSTANPLHNKGGALTSGAAGLAIAATGGLDVATDFAGEMVEEDESPSVLVCVGNFVVGFVVGVIRVAWSIVRMF
jgi:hypothetical protein